MEYQRSKQSLQFYLLYHIEESKAVKQLRGDQWVLMLVLH